MTGDIRQYSICAILLDEHIYDKGKTTMLLRIELNQDFMLIDKRKDAVEG